MSKRKKKKEKKKKSEARNKMYLCVFMSDNRVWLRNEAS